MNKVDTLIQNALVFDGSGAEPAVQDLAVHQGKIVGIGSNLSFTSDHCVNASGLALMPGIIDSHTHFDAQITWDSFIRPSPALGVTTAIIGNCGFAIAPCRPKDRELTMRNLTQVEGMSLQVLQHGIDWDFESFPEYLAMLRKKQCAINVAAYIGHSSVRTWVMGEEANKREATTSEIAEMAELVREAMAAGAIGFATSTSPAHNGEGGFPMPSRLASDEEMMQLTLAMSSQGGGVYMVTKGGQMPVSFLESLAAASKRPVMVAALLHNSTNPNGVFNDLKAITEANQRGHKLTGQVSCCPLSMDFTFASAYPVEGLSSWKPALGLQHAELKTCLASSEFRAKVKEELSQAATFRLFNSEWEKVHVVETFKPENQVYEQQSIAALASQAGLDPLDFALNLALEEDLRTVFTAMLLNSDTDAVAKMLNHPHSLVSLSDAGAHLTFFNDAGFGLHLLGYWSRDMGAMSLSQAVHQLTAQPAEILGLKNRGLLREGYAADLLLFDPQTVGRGPKKRVFDLPLGAPRLHTDALGVHGVWVNGQLIADQNGMLENTKLAGELITEFC
ncbi:MAG: amidohydrolase family protein [Betaproteobacteria bacterium]